MRVDDLGRAPGVLGVDLRGHEHRAVAERARVEDRSDLADDAVVKQALNVGQHLLLGDSGGLGYAQVGTRVQREAALHQVQQLAVGVAERHGGTVRAAAQLGCCGHVA